MIVYLYGLAMGHNRVHRSSGPLSTPTLSPHHIVFSKLAINFSHLSNGNSCICPLAWWVLWRLTGVCGAVLQCASLPGVVIVPHFEYSMYSLQVLGNRHISIFICHVIFFLLDVLKFQSCNNMENLMCYWLFNKLEDVSLFASQSNARDFHIIARIVFAS